MQDRLFALRTAMSSAGVDAYIVPSGDPHLSEYVADHWKFRQWLSGFTGSAGTLVVTEEAAGLWVDSRYFLQGEQQLEGSGIDLFKMATPETPTIEEWLAELLDHGQTVGIDGRLFSVDEIRTMVRELKKSNILLDAQKPLIDEVWPARPHIPDDSLFEHSKKIAGFGRQQKLDMIRCEMEKARATHYITGALDEIAWALNLRGNDIPYNPVFHAYLVIDEETAHLFTDPHKITATIGKLLSQEEVKTSLYDDFYLHLKDLFNRDSHVYFDPKRTNGATLSALPPSIAKTEGTSIIAKLKSIKNQAEIAAFGKAMVKDGVAMVEFLHWLDGAVKTETLTETTIVKQLRMFRGKQEGFWGESFATIAGYGPNGAIVHYKAEKESDATLRPEGILLLDSGGQYPEGTTDLTRTICLGPIPHQAKTDYTLVLKAHIALASAIFPVGTKGMQLDALARQPLWANAMNYGHGTGHGVGCFLNVHEGPQGIGLRENPIPIAEGMINTNEPGLYRTGQYGIRIENMTLTEAHKTTEFDRFLRFKTLTLCPIDTKPVLKELLNDQEIAWLNGYHKTVLETLSPVLTEDLRLYLTDKCQAI